MGEISTLGRLGIDILYSPIQMILDAELIHALRLVLAWFEINDETLAMDIIHQVDPGGLFMADMHTVQHMRTELWQPRMLSKGVGNSGADDHLETDEDRAYYLWREFLMLDPSEEALDERMQRELLKIIDQVAFELQ
jgi:trimethylamine---corrinoid protein Co-methyltransferase